MTHISTYHATAHLQLSMFWTVNNTVGQVGMLRNLLTTKKSNREVWTSIKSTRLVVSRIRYTSDVALCICFYCTWRAKAGMKWLVRRYPIRYPICGRSKIWTKDFPPHFFFTTLHQLAVRFCCNSICWTLPPWQQNPDCVCGEYFLKQQSKQTSPSQPV